MFLMTIDRTMAAITCDNTGSQDVLPKMPVFPVLNEQHTGQFIDMSSTIHVDTNPTPYRPRLDRVFKCSRTGFESASDKRSSDVANLSRSGNERLIADHSPLEATERVSADPIFAILGQAFIDRKFSATLNNEPRSRNLSSLICDYCPVRLWGVSFASKPRTQFEREA